MRALPCMLALISAGALSLSACTPGSTPEAAVALNSYSAEEERVRGEPTREEIKAVLARYYEALETGDLSLISFTPDVVLGLMSGTTVEGEEDVRSFLVNTARMVEDIEVRHTVIEGEYACSMTEYRWTGDVITPLAICFRITGDQISELRPYFDPRPIL